MSLLLAALLFRHAVLQEEDPDEDGLAATAATLDAERKAKELDEASNLVVPSQKEIEHLLLKRRKEVCGDWDADWHADWHAGDSEQPIAVS